MSDRLNGPEDEWFIRPECAPDILIASQKEREAALCACGWHFWQRRKYTNEPYFNHLVNVMNIVHSVPHDEGMMCAAVLHDIVEDTECTLDNLRAWFGDDVASLVEQLTDVSKPTDGNRSARKKLDREHLAKASPRAKTIKLADLIDNSASIMEHDPEFAKVYLAEKRLLLEVLTEGDPALWKRAKETVDANSP